MPLAPQAARRVYDRIGRAQDTQRFYEDAASARLAELARFERSQSVFELGCGTGRYAARLLRERLPADARYLGADVSPRMVRLAQARLQGWTPRARVELLEPPALTLPGAARDYDRFVATYVFDLLVTGYARALIAEAGRLLAPDGLLCLVGLTHGTTPASRLLARSASAIAVRWPGLLGGCRPIELRDLLRPTRWRVEHRAVLTRWGVASEIVVAAKAAAD